MICAHKESIRVEHAHGGDYKFFCGECGMAMVFIPLEHCPHASISDLRNLAGDFLGWHCEDCGANL